MEDSHKDNQERDHIWSQSRTVDFTVSEMGSPYKVVKNDMT